MDEFASLAQTYDWTEQSTDDIAFYLDLASRTSGPILEIGAGTGRVTLPVAQTGKPVTALDVSESMLARAHAKWQATGGCPAIRFVVGDFRSLSLCQTFGLILAPGRVFEHALTDADRQAAFAGCAAHLQPRGVLSLYVWGPPADTDPSPPGKTRQIPPTHEHGTLRFSWQEVRDFKAQTRTHLFDVEELDGLKRIWKHPPIKIRWYTAQVLDMLGEATGLKTEDRFRDFRSSPYETGSLHMVWVCRKQ